jgi:dTDP-4-dehydrorhamnose reductase
MNRIVITGGSGLLGSNISKLATSKFNVYATYSKNEVSMKDVHFFQIDLTKKENLIKIKQIEPNFIIHCAALTNVDYCEEYPKEAYNQNVLASIHIAEVAKKTGSYLIFISTDSVFNGEKGDYKENDTPNPINIYGKTKLEAEKKVLSIYPHSCVVRTNIYGWNKIDKFTLAEWMLNKLTNNEELPGLKDIYFSPMLVNNLAKILFKLQEIKYEGIIHITGSESCSKLDFAYKIAETFNLDKSVIKPISIHELRLKAPRGKNTSLNVSKAEKILEIHLPNVRDGLKQMKKLREEGYSERLKYD